MLLVRVGGNLSNTEKKENKTCDFPKVTSLSHTVVSLPYVFFQPVSSILGKKYKYPTTG